MRRHAREPDYMKIPPLPIHEFRRIESRGPYFIPELAANRRCTDKFFDVIFFINVSFLVVFTVVVIWDKNLTYGLYGQDACGNVCGIKNVYITNMSEGCKVTDYTDYPIFLYEKNRGMCIREEDCKAPEKKLVHRRCFPENMERSRLERLLYETLVHSLESMSTILAMMLVALFLCLLMYLCYLINAHITSMTLTFAGIIFVTLISINSWFLFFKYYKIVYMLPSVLTLIYLAAVVIVLILVGDSFTLVIGLYAQAIKMIRKAPVLLFQPLISIAFVFAVDAALVYMILVLQFCADNVKLAHMSYHTWYAVFLFLMVYWLHGMANGCQCMIVAGVTAAHFFTREEPPHCAYLRSVWVTLRYHLGSVGAGSCVLTFVRIFMPIATCFENNKICFVLFNQCCELVKAHASYFTKKAYIMTALHGRSLHPSGLRTARLVWLFMCDIIAIDNLACTCMHMASFFFLLCSLLVFTLMTAQLELASGARLAVIVLIFSGTITFFYVSLMNTVVETLIVCFCEDRHMNDGSRYNPYYMSSELFGLMIDALELAYKETQTQEDS
ncbi:choline transporter-like protein 3 isoform X1 [Zophobas morio]|uniref:choline transporter-like protein 3 isoform X1 n=1 Tax=Zophobas morio TaxID=2755281 RepID=UPI003082AC5D